MVKDRDYIKQWFNYVKYAPYYSPSPYYSPYGGKAATKRRSSNVPIDKPKQPFILFKPFIWIWRHL